MARKLMSSTMECWDYTNLQTMILSISHSSSKKEKLSIYTTVINTMSSLLWDRNPSLVERSIMTFSRIIAGGSIARKFVYRSNIFDVLNQQLFQHYRSIHVLRELYLNLINIWQKNDDEVPIEFVPQIISISDSLIAHKDEDILGYVLWSITHPANSSSDHVSLVIASGIFKKV
ncbi:Importin subunit alpha-1 [Thelohanellus kitauei]|uniref:Importin subunit alpha-1 n=1 Tax=Thelohanellus kitauei TaxID=669202 RepID=A0A0C2MJV2_THEKT|nr:Importin subunit alpha-1 [Thelohanellus kitauei]